MSASIPPIGELFARMKEMQSRMKEVQDALGAETVTGEAGGGLVVATANGRGELVAVSIDPTLIRPEDAAVVGDLVVAAVNHALKAASELARTRMGELSAQVLPNLTGIPGLNPEDIFPST